MGRLTTSRHGLVRFQSQIINLDHVTYALSRPKTGSTTGQWTFIVSFEGDKQQLTWTYDTEAEAREQLNKFDHLITQEIVEELP